MITLQETLNHSRIKWLVEEIRKRYPGDIVIKGSLSKKGWSENNVNIEIELVKDKDVTVLQTFLQSICIKWKPSVSPHHTFGCFIEFPDFPYLIKIGDSGYFRGRDTKVLIEKEV